MNPTRFPKKLERLKSTRDFREIYRIGNKYPGRYFVLFLRNREDCTVRFGVTASRRIGNAVVRNRAKRIMREAVRKIYPGIEYGMDLILVARPGIRTAGMETVLMQLQAQLKQLDLFDDPLNGKVPCGG